MREKIDRDFPVREKKGEEKVVVETEGWIPLIPHTERD